MNPHRPSCRRPVSVLIAVIVVAASWSGWARADEPVAAPERMLADKAVAAAGGADKRLTLFRMHERFNAGKERATPSAPRAA